MEHRKKILDRADELSDKSEKLNKSASNHSRWFTKI